MHIPELTLFMFNTNNPAKGLATLKYCMDLMSFGDVLFVTNVDLPPVPGIRILKVAESGIGAYQNFVIFELHKHINTSHCMIVHTDGFPINVDLWQPEFLTDYIGAPWEETPKHWGNPHNNPNYRVGNGGFCIRSHKFMKAAATLGYNLFRCPEDVYLAVIVRKELEEMGFKYAPLDLAQRFSFEAELIEYPNRTVNDTFGFHGQFKPWMRALAELKLKNYE